MADREDPLVGFRYGLKLGSKAAGFFTECSGIGSESEVIDHKTVDEKGNEIIGKIPGRLKWQDISLKRPITSAMDLWDWQKEVDEGKLSGARINGSVIMFNLIGDPVAEWTFDRGWIKKVGGPQIKSDSNAVVMEEIVIAHEGLRRTQ
jgi:phage tail-like protein